MTASIYNRVLVAIDGSKRSFQTVDYITQTAPFRKMEINLYHVFNSIPESYWDLEREPSSVNFTAEVRAWENQQRKDIEKHMDQCREMLLAADFHPNYIKLTIHKRKQGIARDIIAESQNGYDAVVMRRRGMSRLPGLIMGSVAYKLMDHIHSVPLIFAGRISTNNRILVAIDGSENSARVLDFVSRMVNVHDYEIALVNVLRKESALAKKNEEISGVLDLSAETASRMQNILSAAKARLQVSGIDENKISVNSIADAHSRAGAIVDMAEKHDFSTIAIGRKGVSGVHDFAMGRVCYKVLHIGRRFNVWIIN